MNNEVFGNSIQVAICKYYGLAHEFDNHRYNYGVVQTLIHNEYPRKIFKEIGSKPIEHLTLSRKFTDAKIRRCPHNFMLDNGQTFSIRSFRSSNQKFAPKVIGQPGVETLNFFLGHLVDYHINQDNFKEFCFTNIHKILPILLDFAFISDYTCFFYRNSNGHFSFNLIERDDIPETEFMRSQFHFTAKNIAFWLESTTIKYGNSTIGELQVHNHRSTPFKLRLDHRNILPLIRENVLNHQEEFSEINNSVIGDSAELAICEIFQLESGISDPRLINNSNSRITQIFKSHYTKHRSALFPKEPKMYLGTETRERGGKSKSGIDFLLDEDLTLSLKTNKNFGKKVCPPEIGQPNPATFDKYFLDLDFYEGPMTKELFRIVVTNPEKVVVLLKKYVEFLNECDYILWTNLELKINNAYSNLIHKKDLVSIEFLPENVSYSNNFQDFNSVTLKYFHKGHNYSLGEFQVHSSRNSLKFRFNMQSLLDIAYD